MNIKRMTRRQFDALPFRESWGSDEPPFDSLVLLPLRRRHDSGFRCMDIVGCRGDEAVCRLSGCSDVLHFDGVGGYGKDWLKRYAGVPKMVEAAGWTMDCLPTSGLLRIFCSGRIVADSALSSFEFYSVPREEKP